MGHFSRDCPRKTTDGERNNSVVGNVSTNLTPPQQSMSQDINVNQKGTRAELRRVEVKCGPRMVQAIIDSGAEISVVRDGVAPEMEGSSGRVTLTGAFGNSVSAVLRHIPMTLPTSYVEYVPREVPLLCAVTEQLVNVIDILVTPEDFDSLKLACGRVDLEPRVCEAEDALTDEGDEVADDNEGALSAQVSVGQLENCPIVTQISSPRFLELQKNDDTLKVL